LASTGLVVFRLVWLFFPVDLVAIHHVIDVDISPVSAARVAHAPVASALDDALVLRVLPISNRLQLHLSATPTGVRPTSLYLRSILLRLAVLTPPPGPIQPISLLGAEHDFLLNMVNVLLTDPHSFNQRMIFQLHVLALFSKLVIGKNDLFELFLCGSLCLLASL